MATNIELIPDALPISERFTPVGIQALMGPVRSIALYTLYHTTGGKLHTFGPDNLHDYFQHQEHEITADIQETHAILTDIESRFDTTTGPAEHFIGGDLYDKWMAVKECLQQELDPTATTTISDYVVTKKDPDGSAHHILFGIKEKEIIMIPLTGDIPTRHAMLSEMAQQKNRAPRTPLTETESAVPYASSIMTEMAIGELLEANGIDRTNASIRRISPVTNAFQLPRHKGLEREGEVFTNLRNLGAWSIGEIQEAQRQLINKGTVAHEDGSLSMNEGLVELCVSAHTLNNPDMTRQQAKEALTKFARERVYHQTVIQRLKGHPELIDSFISSGLYSQYAQEFKDKHLSSIGLTEREVAEMMIAGFHLYRFEGTGSLNSSPSLGFMKDTPSFITDIELFIEEHPATDIPNIPVSFTVSDQGQALGKLLQSGDTSKLPYMKAHRLAAPEQEKLIREGHGKLRECGYQIRRNRYHQKVVNQMDKSKHLAVDTKRRKGIFPTFIANVGLARVPGEKKQTEVSWFPFTDGYLPDGKSLPPLGEPKPHETVHEAISYIFNGAVYEGQSAYDSQEARIYEAAPTILRYLQTDPSVPETIREFLSDITTDQLAERVLTTFCSANEQDPNIINRFFPKGVADFQLMTAYRYVFDFVHGVETNLIFQTQKGMKKLGRHFGVWRNWDFHDVNKEAAITKTLEHGAHRIDVLNHKPDVKKSTLKDWQEYFEVAFGWDTLDMKYLRWQSHWNINNTLGGAWDCICFSRKGIFNPNVFHQW